MYALKLMRTYKIMPAAGLEPARRCRQQILSLPRLPIPTRRHVLPNKKYTTIFQENVQVFFYNFIIFLISE